MKYQNRLLNIFVLFALLAVSLGVMAQPAAAADPYVCVPTCSTTDGRMLSLASVGYETLAGATISLKISAPATMSSFEIGLFDGDTGGMWDKGSTPLVYTLYADPTAGGNTSVKLTQWTGASMTDNAWTDFTVNQDPQALAPSGDYFYHLHIDLPDASTVLTWSNFKLRSNSPIELSTNESFAYSVPAFTKNEANIIYPSGFPSVTTPNVPTTFDGTWDIYLNIPTSSPSFVIWDGDMDFGSYDCSVNDTNDSDTPDGVLPPWATGISDVPEDVAVSSLKCMDSTGQVITGPQGEIFTTSNPADDSRSLTARRSPSVVYDVIGPNGDVYHNDNSSGNKEWEQFLIDSDPNTSADYHVNGLLPAGIYHIHVTGLDTVNLNAWHLISGTMVCVLEDGTPCIPVLHPYLIGDTIWNDADGNGIQDNGEVGIAGVTVTLLDANGQPIPGKTAVTDANGQYTFKVEAGTYSVQVDASNFNPGGALAGNVSTTGGETQTNTVTTDNVLTYDFGYRQLASLGDKVWNDLNGNGLQDSGEAGLAGVTVNLLGSDGVTVLGTKTTDANGNYSFTDLVVGTYFVQFTAPEFTFTTKNAAGSTSANDSNVNLSTGKTDAIPLAVGVNDTSIDAGLYLPASLGDKVWNDLNGNGIQESGEPGIAGVTVNLLGSDGTTVIGTKTTDSNGSYSFTDLVAGTYFVQFTAPSGFTFTTKNAAGSTTANDSNANLSTGKTDAINLAAGVNDTTIDAGLYLPASLGDKVWKDLNGNGLQDTGEPGLAGVTVNLLGSDGTTVLATKTTDANGIYSFTNLPAGSYTVQFVASTGFTFSPSNVGTDDAKDSDANTSTGKTGVYTLVAGQNNTSVDAGLKQSLTLSCPGNLVLNPSFELNTGSPITNWTNGTAGNIGIPSPDGKNVAYISGTGTMYQKVNVSVGNSYTLTFFSGSHVPSIQTVKIRYFTSSNTAIGTASVHTITSDLQVTGFGGPYTLSLGAAPSNAKYLKIMVSANDKDYAKVDALCLQATTPPSTASIGDKVWNDLNGNGLQDSGEAGYAGVTVKLLGSDGATVLATKTTDAAGNYSFTNLLAGTYTVQFVAPTGTTFTTANVGTDDAKDSDANATTGKTGVYTLATGQTNTTVDAGLKQSMSLSCPGNLVLNPSFELNSGSPITNWTNGTAGNIGIPSPDGNNVAYISGTGVMSQKVNVVVGKSYTFTFFSGSHVPSIQTVKIQYFTSSGSAIGTASTHTITSDLQVTGFGGPYTLTLGAAPSNAAYLKVMVSANGQDYAKVDALCLQTTP